MVSVMTGPKRSREPATRASPGEHAGAPARRGSGEFRAAARAARGPRRARPAAGELLYSTRSDKRSEREDTS